MAAAHTFKRGARHAVEPAWFFLALTVGAHRCHIRAMPPPKIENYYDKLDKKFREEEQHYDSEKDIKIKVPFRMLVIGATGSGKTNAVENVVRHINTWDHILLFAKNVEEPLWAQFIDHMRKVEKDTHVDILTVDTDLNHLPSVDKLDKKSSTLLILDDMMSESPKLIRQHVEPWWTRGRKMHASCIWLGQSYFKGVPLSLRQNSDYIILTKIRGNGDLHRILSEYPLDVSKDEIVRLYHEATKGGFPNFFLIDLNAKENGSVGMEYRYRRNYEPLKYNHIDGKKAENKEEKEESTPSKKRKAPPEASSGSSKQPPPAARKGRKGTVSVSVTPTPSKKPYENKPVPLMRQLPTVPEGNPMTRLKKFEGWFHGLTEREQRDYAEYLKDAGVKRNDAAMKLVRAMLHDDDAEMRQAERDIMEEDDPEAVLGRYTEAMEDDPDFMQEGEGLARKRRRVGAKKVRARSAARPLPRHTTELQKALERLAGRRAHAYWS
jgi:Poxvirus A32 protein